MQANKDKSVQIKESDADHYHVEFIKHVIPKGTLKTVERKHVQIFSVRDFRELNKTIDRQGIFVTGWHELRILHDPIAYKAECEREAEAQALAAAKAEAKAKAEAAAKEKAEAEAKAKEKAEEKAVKPTAKGKAKVELQKDET